MTTMVTVTFPQRALIRRNIAAERKQRALEAAQSALRALNNAWEQVEFDGAVAMWRPTQAETIGNLTEVHLHAENDFAAASRELRDAESDLTREIVKAVEHEARRVLQTPGGR